MRIKNAIICMGHGPMATSMEASMAKSMAHGASMDGGIRSNGFCEGGSEV